MKDIKLIGKISIIGSMIIAFLYILSLLANFFYLFEMISNFKLQLFFASLPSPIILGIMREKRWLLPTLALTMLLCWQSFEIYTTSKNEEKVLDSKKIYCANILTTNTNYNKVLSEIKDEDPDIIILQETGKDWIKETEILKKDYRYSVHQTREDNFGIAVFSKHLTEELKITFFEENLLPSVTCKIYFGKKRVELITTHPTPPMTQKLHNQRNDQLMSISKYINQCGSPAILLGDLNCTSYSPFFKYFLSKSNMVDSRRGFGIQHSWSVTNPLFALTLDHCLVSPQIKIIDRRIGKDIGSDHRALIIELGI